jgi:hypothetical protein
MRFLYLQVDRTPIPIAALHSDAGSEFGGQFNLAVSSEAYRSVLPARLPELNGQVRAFAPSAPRPSLEGPVQAR